MCDDRYRNNTQIVNRMLLLNGNSPLTYLWTLAPLLLFLKANTTFVFFISCSLIGLQVTLDRHGIIVHNMATTSYCLCNMLRKSTLRLMRLLDYVFLLGASNFDLIARRVMMIWK